MMSELVGENSTGWSGVKFHSFVSGFLAKRGVLGAWIWYIGDPKRWEDLGFLISPDLNLFDFVRLSLHFLISSLPNL